MLNENNHLDSAFEVDMAASSLQKRGEASKTEPSKILETHKFKDF